MLPARRTAQVHRTRDANERMWWPPQHNLTECETQTRGWWLHTQLNTRHARQLEVLPGTAQPHQTRTRGKGGRKPIKRETRMTGGSSAWHGTTPRRTRDAKDGEQEEDVASTPSANATCEREEDVAGTPSSNATYEWWWHLHSPSNAKGDGGCATHGSLYSDDVCLSMAYRRPPSRWPRCRRKSPLVGRCTRVVRATPPS